MFIYSVRASALRFAVVLALCIAAMALFLAFVPVYNEGEPTYAGADGTDAPAFLSEYIENLGWSVSETPEKAEYTIPAVFDADAEAYNEIQKKQGFDLTGYSGETALKYTYEITNYDDYEGTVYLNLLTVSGNVIGGDIRTADDEGFILGIDGR